jgi:hypothetical protein
MSRRLQVALFCVLCNIAGLGQSIINVPYQKSTTFPVAGATAAYSLDSTIAETTVSGEVIEVYGKSPGTTHVIVVTSGGVQSFSVSVPQPPPMLPPELIAQQSENGESGSYEFRYTSDPRQITNSFEFKRAQGDSFNRLQLINANLLRRSSSSAIGFPLASYEIGRRTRDIILLDENVSHSPLTFDGYMVRGVHYRQGPWEFHAGVTSIATFQGLFLATDPEKLAGISRRFSLNKTSSIFGNLYYFSNPASTRPAAKDGAMGSVAYEYRPTENLYVLSELGISRGAAFATQGRYDDLKTHIEGRFRAQPGKFAALAVNNLRGTFTDLNASRTLSSRLSGNFAVTQSNYNLINLRQNTFSSNLSLTYKVTRGISLIGGTALSRFQSKLPLTSAIRTLNLPLGIDFSSQHFGAGFQYQSTTNFKGSHGNDFGVNLRGSVRQFQLSTFFRRNVQVPTVEAIFAQLPGLQDVLERSGIIAATPDQIAQLLRNTALLTTLGFSDALTVNLSPARTDIGSSLNWASLRSGRAQVSMSLLSSKTDLLQGNSFRFTTASVSYSRRLTASNDIVFSASLFRTQDGITSNTRPLFDVSIRHKFFSAPSFLLPGRHGTISGHIFRDDEDTAQYSGSQEAIPGIEVRLDENRVTRTDNNGFYSFNRVPFGQHRVEAKFQSDEPFFFTTNSPAIAEINSKVDFGINFQKGQIFGYLRNDAGGGIPGVVVELQGAGISRRIRTATDGKFTLSGLSGGTYKIATLPDSYPPGYPLQNLPETAVALVPGSPAKVEFTIRATRVISGRVVAYDRETLKTVPLEGVTVRLVEASLEVKTSVNGAFVFRNLSAGTCTVSVTYDGKETLRLLTLPPEPVNLRDVELNVGTK